MTYREEILQQVLALPLADRAFVAAALEESLTAAAAAIPRDVVNARGPDTGSAAELLAELQRRSTAYKNGAMASRPAAEVIADLRNTPTGG